MNKKGFTLIEIIIVMTILAIFSATFATFISQATDAWFFIKSRSSASGTARYSLNRIAAEVRRLNGVANISTMLSSEFQFVDINGTTIDFKLQGNSIYRNADILADNATNPNGLVFTYLDSTGAVTAVKASITSVRIRVAIQKNQQTSVLETTARVRNL